METAHVLYFTWPCQQGRRWAVHSRLVWQSCDLAAFLTDFGAGGVWFGFPQNDFYFLMIDRKLALTSPRATSLSPLAHPCPMSNVRKPDNSRIL